MAEGTCDIAALTSVGNIARGFAEVSDTSATGMGTAAGSANASRGGGLRSVRELNGLADSWTYGNFNAQRATLVAVGDQLVATAGHYAAGDQASADEFEHLPTGADRNTPAPR